MRESMLTKSFDEKRKSVYETFSLQSSLENELDREKIVTLKRKLNETPISQDDDENLSVISTLKPLVP